PHGYAADQAQAAMEAVTAGCDMDMESRCYTTQLVRLVREHKVSMTLIDDAVRRILTKKFEMGLFDDPYRFCNDRRAAAQWNNAANLDAEQRIAEKSIVLLKNDHGLLPLAKNAGAIALIGPLMKSIRENLGFWSYNYADDSARIVSPYDGIAAKAGNASKLLYARGCGIDDSSTAGFAEAVAAASRADVVIMDVGEAPDMSGEAKSRSNLHLPGVQEELIKAVAATGKPVIVMIGAGRPLIFNWTADHVAAILYTWWLGTRAGSAMADVLFGDYNPSGKLPISFPRAEGGIPVYYDHVNTGRPAKNDSDIYYVSAYIDLLNGARFPFGFGLSYTQFSYSDISLSAPAFRPGGRLTASVTLTNKGPFDGKETVQLYIRDMVGSVVRPVKELKGFQQVFLRAGESKKVSFTIGADDLRFYNDRLDYIYEPGDFTIYIGGNSRDVKSAKFTLAAR
ncbi:MAG TPA: glycoside hydrolase family 3 C-terminal domain-containing protein, partial [Puia sp.]|nr:glycoside hydrolase family 3 C-terminal domain-containing protein [Puia sp.]